MSRIKLLTRRCVASVLIITSGACLGIAAALTAKEDSAWLRETLGRLQCGAPPSTTPPTS